MKLRKVLRRIPSAVVTLAACVPLVVRNFVSNESIVTNGGGPVVTLTTHGRRLRYVFLVIESITRGTRRPPRVVLYLDPPKHARTLPGSLRRLINRGLEVEFSRGNYGPHTKYYPYVESTPMHYLALITADDDIIYPNTWYENLASANDRDSTSIIANRALEISVTDGKLGKYRTWANVSDANPRRSNFVTGVSGVVYPASFLQELKRAGSIFMQVCPRADDIWLNVIALRAGLEVRQRTGKSEHYRVIPLTQAIALSSSNNNLGHNDLQLKATYSADDIAAISVGCRVADDRKGG